MSELLNTEACPACGETLGATKKCGEMVIDTMRLRQWAAQLRMYCHATFNGGHHTEPAHGAFHHGMDTVCNVLIDYLRIAHEEEVRHE